VLLATAYQTPGRARSDADIIELLTFKNPSILAGDLIAKRPFLNNVASSPSGEKPLDLFDIN
jgi:hypothetical protein